MDGWTSKVVTGSMYVRASQALYGSTALSALVTPRWRPRTKVGAWDEEGVCVRGRVSEVGFSHLLAEVFAHGESCDCTSYVHTLCCTSMYGAAVVDSSTPQ